jgi:hypothetical protein
MRGMKNIINVSKWCSLVAAIGLVFLPWLGPAPAATNGAAASSAQRALAAYEAQEAFLSRSGFLRLFDPESRNLEEVPNAKQGLYAYLWSRLHDSSLWSYSQAIAATQVMMGLPLVGSDWAEVLPAQIDGGLATYWDATAYRPYLRLWQNARAARFYDDNAWVGLNLVRAYRMTGDRQALAQAEALFEYITTGWDQDPAHPAPGGIFWAQSSSNRDRNTCSNAPAAELGLRLYQLTGDKTYLSWATRMYEWVRGTLLDADGLYWDRIDLHGNIERTKWSYNQGTMMGAGVLLYKITGNAVYLEAAKTTAAAALDYYRASGYWQPPAFNAIFFRNLLLLSTVDATYLPATRQAMQRYADHAWQNNRSSANLFSFPARSGTTRLLDQAGMVQILACLGWDPAKYDLLV